MNREHTPLGFACLVTLLSIFLGCNPETESSNHHDEHGHHHEHDHDHSGRPETLQAAIMELVVVRDNIRTSMENDDPESAHDPLHRAGELLQAMPELAADTDLPESEWNSINEESDRLLDAFDELDSAFHEDSDPQVAYESASSAIDEGVAAMEAKLPLLGAEPMGSDSEHSQGEDEESQNNN